MPWEISGNAGTDPKANFLGTTDGQPLVIKTAGREAMRVAVNGNVGVSGSSERSITNPLAPLDIAYGVQLSGQINDEVGLRNNYHIIAGGIIGNLDFGIRFCRGDYNPHETETDNQTHLMTISSEGRVGIGQQPSGEAGQLRNPTNWLNLPPGGLTIGNGRRQDENFTLRVDDTGGPPALRIYAHMFPDSEPIRNFLTITKEGRVGIGTPSPAETLTVSGIIETSVGFKLPDGTVMRTREEFRGPQGVPGPPGPQGPQGPEGPAGPKG